jgi:hypothetical protein
MHADYAGRSDSVTGSRKLVRRLCARDSKSRVAGTFPTVKR